jgi:hypothetical protein
MRSLFLSAGGILCILVSGCRQAEPELRVSFDDKGWPQFGSGYEGMAQARSILRSDGTPVGGVEFEYAKSLSFPGKGRHLTFTGTAKSVEGTQVVVEGELVVEEGVWLKVLDVRDGKLSLDGQPQPLPAKIPAGSHRIVIRGELGRTIDTSYPVTQPTP